MGLVIATCSGKGGVGKSMFSVNTAIALEKEGKKVLLIDMDAGMRCLDLLLGVNEKLVFDVFDAISGKQLEDCLLRISEEKELYLLAAPSTKVQIDKEKWEQFIKYISEKFDVVIIDFPAGNDVSLLYCLPYDAQIICVANPDAVSVRDASAIGSLLLKGNKKPKLVINKYNYYFIKGNTFSNLDDIINETGMQLLGIVPFSEGLEYAFCTGDFKIKGREKRAFRRIAKRLDGKSIPLPKLKKI
ncbi:MAG: P-loop NTPase [Clostridia bacterium]|nr:P-loop NTPase [Clostridia bacterium]